ncbi:Valyl-tRNA synthetase [Archaeoglobus fulgidus DSM 8774]|uniref:valine--tRNA ligase n=1 Tax=Archaeoglobus fulgidus DSM 8774 TaxID=1344584 RepID=A0A075WDS4_ARCFL|nr:class I tRNA ligase family protein [Archaeoglobus fulgidus]AIG98141.1 Valyl-tRNA synthetase [Archaeoglobus fulgidus DSM 8774]
MNDYIGFENRKYLRDADKWILSELNRLVKEVDDHMENYRFSDALKAIRNFTWYEYADNYLEIVKNRLYAGTDDEKRAARYVLYTVMDTLIRLIAPFTPFMAEECWSIFKGEGSVHLQSYPEFREDMVDEEAEEKGRLIRDIVAAIRRMKHDKGLALNAPLKNVRVFSPVEIDVRDIAGAVNSNVELLKEMPEIETRVKALKPKYGILGPMFKEKVKSLISAVNALPDEEKMKFVKEGSITVELDGESVEVKGEWFDVEMEKIVGGESVEVLEVGNTIVVVEI